MMTGGQANFFQSLGWAVLNSLWQLALLWVLYQIITGLFKTAKPFFKSFLASSLLIAGFTWFVYTFLTVYSSRAITEGSLSSGIITDGNPGLSNWLKETLPLASVIYLILLVLPLLRFVRNYRYVQIIRQYGRTKMNVEWRMFVNKVAMRMGIKKQVSIWVSELVSSPVTMGFLKPVILVPLAAINNLTPQQLEAVLLHELSHIKRYDYLINLVINFIQAILYFNPFVKALVKIVEKERENSCDEMVLQFQYNSHEYAAALLLLEKTSHTDKPLAIAAAGKKHDLLQRIESIMGVQQKPIISFNSLAGVFAALLCIIALNALLIISRPLQGRQAISFTGLSTPFHFFDVAEEEGTVMVLAAENKPATLINPSPFSTNPQQEYSSASYIADAVSNPDIINVHYEPVVVPLLKKYQEQQVKVAMEASKKVLENLQWKQVEKSIADVFTQMEKEELKSTYEKEISKIDWNEWENNLRAAYDKVDWENVNKQLAKAVNEVRIDSLQKVYTLAITQLEKVKEEMVANHLTGIPDTDVSLKRVEQSRKDALKVLNNVRALRSKKIVHL